jgi:FkbM family methyltransferase
MPKATKDCRHGRISYLTTDAYVGRSLDLYGEYCEGEVILFRNLLRPGDVAVDVGANIGAHTIPLAKMVGPTGRVHAFEPQARMFELLTENVGLNVLGNVEARQAALGAAPGTAKVPPIDYETLGNFGGVAVNGADGDDVPLVTIDSLELPSVRLIKIDVEGMEVDVLQGAAATIARHGPILYCEADDPENSIAVVTWLFEHAYRAWWHMPPMFNQQNFRANPVNVFGNTIAMNAVALPNKIMPPPWPLREIRDPTELARNMYRQERV